MSPLAPCSGCRRHVRVSDSACPFCGAAAVPTARSPLAAVGVLALGALLPVACSRSEPVSADPAGAPSATDASSVGAMRRSPLPEQPTAMAPAYGMPLPPTASASASAPPTASASAKPPLPQPVPHRAAAPAYGLAPHRNPDKLPQP